MFTVISVTIFLLLFFFIIFNYVAFIQGAPYVPSKKSNVEDIAELVKTSKHKMAVDLGSGDGRIVIALAKLGYKTHGYEINPVLVLYSTILIHRLRLQNKACIHWKSFWKEDLSEFDLITVYCLPGHMKALETKLIRELKPATEIISNTFSFPDLKVIKQKGNVRLYQIL